MNNTDRAPVLPSPWRRLATPAVVGIVLAMPFQVGTGGYATAQYHSQRRAIGYSVISNSEADQVTEAGQEQGVDSDLKFVREFLRPSVSELARAFGVSRQAIYDWQNGTNISDSNRERIAELAKACAKLITADIGGGQELLRRKISDGMNLIEQVAAGKSGAVAAYALIDILTTERQQREAVSRRLASRGKRSMDLSDAGLPVLDEDG